MVLGESLWYGDPKEINEKSDDQASWLKYVEIIFLMAIPPKKLKYVFREPQ